MIDALRAIFVLCWLMSFAGYALDTLHAGRPLWWLAADLALTGLGPLAGLYLLKDNA